eukprot:m.805527 g.805527  ORF g.805527 m.805527 type:complete len:73 (-) comp59290_c0_seq12:9879-10097(-)
MIGVSAVMVTYCVAYCCRRQMLVVFAQEAGILWICAASNRVRHQPSALLSVPPPPPACPHSSPLSLDASVLP